MRRSWVQAGPQGSLDPALPGIRLPVPCTSRMSMITCVEHILNTYLQKGANIINKLSDREPDRPSFLCQSLHVQVVGPDIFM